MPRSLVIQVVGVAQPQGSTRAFVVKGLKRPVVTSDNKSVRGWRDLVAKATSDAIQAQQWRVATGPVRLMAQFYLPRPKSLRQRTDVPHVTKPDLDKLARATGDALTGVAYTDDRQVGQFKCEKAYAAPGEPPRAVIVVTTLTEE
jgi:crossover junction endodeoxyribonuclease RusA